MRAVLANRDFRLLWLGQSTSVVGDALVIVALGLFVTDLTGDAGDVGIVLTAYAGPLVAFVLAGGVIADRLPRRAVVIGTDLIRCALHALLALLIALDAVRVWHMVVIGVLFGAAEAFFRPALTGLVPQTVPEEQIQESQAVLGVTREGAMILGPVLATALFFGVGAAFAFAIDAATFLVSAVLLLRVRPRARGIAVASEGFWRALRAGWVAVRERVWVLAIVSAFSFSLFACLAPYFVLGPTIGDEQYGTAAVYGVVQATWGAGTLLGSLGGLRWRPRYPMRAGMLVALVWPVPVTAFALGAPVWIVYAVTVGGGAGIGLFGVWWETALAERIPPHLLSRVSAYDWMGSLALLPLGYVVAGQLGEAVGASEVLAIGSLLSVLVLAAALIPRDTRMLARIERGATAAVGLAEPPPTERAVVAP